MVMYPEKGIAVDGYRRLFVSADCFQKIVVTEPLRTANSRERASARH